MTTDTQIPTMGVAIIYAAVGVSSGGAQMWQEVARQPLEMLLVRTPDQGIIIRQTQISDVQSPPGNRISCARTAPCGSREKSTKNSSLTLNPPCRVSQSTCIK